jgi:alpha-L-rhamnosidase
VGALNFEGLTARLTTMRLRRRHFLHGPWLGGLSTRAAAGDPGGATTDAGRWQVENLKVDGLPDPLGLDSARPRLSWNVTDRRQAPGRQSAYRIRVASRLDHLARGPWLWDSGRVDSDASLDIAYGGPALQPRQRVWWTVTVWDASGRHARPARPGCWEMGLLRETDWSARWLEAESPEARERRLDRPHWVWGTSDNAEPRCLRWHFEAPPQASGLALTVSAKDDLRGLWLDGQPLLAPGQRLHWGQGATLPLPPLAPGRHVLALEVALRLDEARPVIGGAVAARLEWRGPEGQHLRKAASEGWRTRVGAEPEWMAPAHDDSTWAVAGPARISPPCHPWATGPAVLLRHAFRIDRPSQRARLYATALGSYAIEINGRALEGALLAPESTDFRRRALVQVFDVTDALQPGDNALGAWVGDGWFGSPFSFLLLRYGLGDPPRRLRLQLELTFDDGTSQRVATGQGDWRLGASPVVLSEIYEGEHHDGRLEQPGFSRAGFDADHWQPARVGEAPAVALAMQAGPKIVRRHQLQPQRITAGPDGTWIVDFGQNFSGWCGLQVRGPRGTRVTLRHAEALHPDGRLNVTSNRRAAQTDVYVLRGDPDGESWEPRFTFHGFRYVEVQGWPGKLQPEHLTGVVVYSDAPETLQLRVGHPLVQQLVDNTRWSQRSNFIGVPIDCPQRDERMAWIGDAQIYWDAAAFLMDVGPFTRRYMADVRAGQLPTGEMPDIAPYWALGQNTPGWADGAVILPWTVWQRSGDTAILEENWPAMWRYAQRLSELNPDLVWRHGRGMDYGDWLSVDARSRQDETTPKTLIASAYWAQGCGLMAQMAVAIGRHTEAALLRSRQQGIVRAWRQSFMGVGGLVGNGSQTSQALALRFGLLPAGLRAAAAARLAAEVRGRGVHLSTGFIGTPYLLDALADHGHGALAVELLLQTGYPSWGYQIAQGATTVFERWNGLRDGVVTGSLNHYALGAVCGFVFRRLLGIDAAAPGFKRIALRPLTDPRIGAVEGVYESALGPVASAWHWEGPVLSLRFSVPAQAEAQLELELLPGTRLTRDNGRADDILHRGSSAKALLGPGRHALRATQRPPR